MLGFAIKRVFWLIPTLLVMTLLTYFIMELTPGSPFDLENANGITPEMIARLEAQYGLDAGHPLLTGEVSPRPRPGRGRRPRPAGVP